MYYAICKMCLNIAILLNNYIFIMDIEDSQTISALKNEIAALKEQIKLSKEQETQSQQTLNKIKQIHKEFSSMVLYSDIAVK